MFITQTQIPLEIKKEEVFAVLESLKSYNFKVKAYYFWLKTKNKLSEIDIEKAYNLVVASISEVKEDEINRKFGMFEKNKQIMKKRNLEELSEKEDEEIDIII